jgi:hypothetical protein
MEYAVDMGVGFMIYIPVFIKIISTIQKFMRRMHRDTDI